MRFSPGCGCCGLSVPIPCGVGVIVNVSRNLWVTIIDEDGLCTPLSGLTFQLVHYPPYDNTGGMPGTNQRYWYPTTWDGSTTVPLLPCDTGFKLTQWIGIACAGAGNYYFYLHGVGGTSPTTNISGVVLTAAELAASPLVVEWVAVIAADVFECCSTYPANIRIIITDVPPP